MALELLGGLFGAVDPLTRVYRYLEGVRETKEIKQRLRGALVSLRLFMESSKASHVSGEALAGRLKTASAFVMVTFNLDSTFDMALSPSPRQI